MPQWDSEPLQSSTSDQVKFSPSDIKVLNDALLTKIALFLNANNCWQFPVATVLLCDCNVFLSHHILLIAPL